MLCAPEGLPADYDSSNFELVYAITPYDPKKPQQTKDALAKPHELRNFRAFDADADAANFKNVDRHALDVATHNGEYSSFKHLCWALTGRGAITDDCERLRCARARTSTLLVQYCSAEQ